MSMITDDNGSGKTPGDDTTASPTETAVEHAPDSADSAETALAQLRNTLDSSDASVLVAPALDALDQAVRRPRAELSDGGDDNPPTSSRHRMNGGHDGEGNDDQPPTSRTPPPAQSRFALRDDGALLVSLEDAPDRDTTGRDVIAFLVLSEQEAGHARAAAEQTLAGAAAKIIARLPRRKP